MNAAARNPAQSGVDFTIEDVQRRLPLVRSIVADITRLHEDLRERRDRLANVRRLPRKTSQENNVYEEEMREIERGIERDDATLDGYIDELENLGGELRDPATGRVEFAGQMDGRRVFWGLEPGQDEPGYWRDAESAGSQRHSLVEWTVAEEDDSP